MSKDIASFDSSELNNLTNALRAFGYSFLHPERKTITAWDSNGGELELDSPADGLTFLAERRGGVQLWRSATEDVFLSMCEGMLRLYFDGFTPAEQKTLVEFLEYKGLKFTVANENATYGA